MPVRNATRSVRYGFDLRITAAARALAVLLPILLAIGAATARASTIAYVNASNGNVYVVSSVGTDRHEVATGLTSPALTSNGDLYALAGSQVDVFAPGMGAQTPIPITASSPSQLAVSPSGGRLAITDGTPLDTDTSVDVITRSSGAVQTLPNALGPHWVNSYSLTASAFNLMDPSEFGHSLLYNGLYTRPLWFPGLGIPGPVLQIPLEYAVNPAHTEAAAVVLTATPDIEEVLLVVFPINRLLSPAAIPVLKTGNACQIGGTTEANSPAGPAGGLAFAWSPSGSALAYTSLAGIDTIKVGATWNSDCSQVGTPLLFIPGGYAPSWGPSNRRDFPAPATGSGLAISP